MEDQWYLMYNNQQVGPMSAQQMLAYGLNPNTQVWKEGMGQWAPVYTIPELMGLCQTPSGQHVQGAPGCPPPAGGAGYNNGGYVSQPGDKSKTTCGILALLLGGLGIQYFYLGKPMPGIITIIATICTCGIYDILMFIQGILILTMSEQDFQRKFVNPAVSFPFF